MFILVNKWDESDSDHTSSTDKSKIVIENNLIQWFLKSNETNQEEARKKIFFVSAKEQINYVTNTDEDSNDCLSDKASFRKNEFERFINELKVII